MAGASDTRSAPSPPCSTMTENRRLGGCPNCGHAIRPIDELITYERSDESIGVYAECPSCEEVVSPE